MSLVKMKKLNTHRLVANFSFCFSVNLVFSPSHYQNIDFLFKVKTDLFLQAITSPKHALMQEEGQTAVLGQGLVLCGVFSLIAKG